MFVDGARIPEASELARGVADEALQRPGFVIVATVP